MLAMISWLSLVPPLPLLALSLSPEGRRRSAAALAHPTWQSVLALGYMVFISTTVAFWRLASSSSLSGTTPALWRSWCGLGNAHCSGRGRRALHDTPVSPVWPYFRRARDIVLPSRSVCRGSGGLSWPIPLRRPLLHRFDLRSSSPEEDERDDEALRSDHDRIPEARIDVASGGGDGEHRCRQEAAEPAIADVIRQRHAGIADRVGELTSQAAIGRRPCHQDDEQISRTTVITV